MSDYSYLTGEGTPSLPELGTEIAASLVPGLNVAQALRDYKKAAKENKYVDMGLAALGLVPGVGAASHAALAAGLRADLLLSHSSAVGRLLRGKELLPELQSPSFAITKDAGQRFGGRVMLVPKEGKFDPATTNSRLYGTDAGTTSFAQTAVGQGGNTPTNRLRDRFELPASYNESKTPQFGSFEAYENSLYGANRLDSTVSAEPFYKAMQVIKDATGRYGPLDTSGAKYTPEQLDQIYRGIAAWRQRPASFGELKVPGPVQLSPHNFAGIISNKFNAPQLALAAKLRGIPFEVNTSDDLANAFSIAKQMQKVAK